MEKWIVVKNTAARNDPRAAQVDYIANVFDFDRFNKHLMKSGGYAFKYDSYAKYFERRVNLEAVRTQTY